MTEEKIQEVEEELKLWENVATESYWMMERCLEDKKGENKMPNHTIKLTPESKEIIAKLKNREVIVFHHDGIIELNHQDGRTFIIEPSPDYKLPESGWPDLPTQFDILVERYANLASEIEQWITWADMVADAYDAGKYNEVKRLLCIRPRYTLVQREVERYE